MTDFATGEFRCPKCNGRIFKCYPQTQTVGAKIQTWEYTCVECNTVTALTIQDWRDEYGNEI